MNAAGFRADIQGLRALSVLMVLAFHLRLRGSGGGFIGVDAFFVLSGYLMTRLVVADLSQGGLRYGRFLVARAGRLWPALAGVVGLLLLVGAVALPPFDLVTLAEQVGPTLVFASNHHYLAHAGYNTWNADTNWLLHSWSLSVEWQFYLLYPLWLAGAAWLGRRCDAGERTRRWALTGAVALLAVASLVFYLFEVTRQPDRAFFLLPARAWEMAAGGLAFLWQPASPTPGRWRVAMSHAGLALIVGSALWIGVRHLPPVGLGVHALLPVAGVVMVLGAGHASNRWLRARWLQALGAGSYSVYLWHWPVIVALRMTDGFELYPKSTAAFAVLASLVLGAASHRWIEPLGHAAQRLGAWRTVRKPVWAMAVSGVLCAAVIATDGLAFRDARGAEFYPGYVASWKPLYYPDACSNFLKPVAQLKPCTIDKPDHSRRVLVIGDSHGEHLYPWFVKHSRVPVDFFTVAECPPVPHFERMQPGFHCAAYADEAWRRAASPTYDTVVVSARWATVGLNGAPYCHRQASGACEYPDEGEDKQQRVREELRRAIEATLAAGKTVLVLDASPESPARVPERLAREMFWFGAPRLSIERSALNALAGWVDPVFEGFAGRPGFHRVSLRDRLCDATRCRVFDEQLKRPIYIDESHFDPHWIAAQDDLLKASNVTQRRD